MGDESQQTTTEGNSEPWSPSQPYLQGNMQFAQDLQSAGIGGGVYQGNTVTPFSRQTQQGMNRMLGHANANLNGNGMSGTYNRVLRNNGETGRQSGAMDTMDRFSSGQGNVSGNTQRQFASGAGDVSGYMQRQFAGGAGDVGGARLNNFANGNQNVSTGGVDQIGRNAMQNGYSENNLGQFASGDNLGQQNPQFEAALQAATDKTRASVDMSAAAAGRYGSGSHAGVVADRVGDLQATQRTNQYNQDRNVMLQANQMMDNQRNTGLGMGLSAANSSAGIQSQNNAMQMGAMQSQMANNQQNMARRTSAADSLASIRGQNSNRRLGAADSLASIRGQNANRQLGAAGDLYNAGQQSFRNLGEAYQGAQAPLRDMMAVGGMNEDLMSRQLEADRARFYEMQDAPWQQLARSNAIFSGAGSLGGTQRQTVSQPGPSPFAQIGGAMLAGGGLLGGMGMGPASVGGY